MKKISIILTFLLINLLVGKTLAQKTRSNLQQQFLYNQYLKKGILKINNYKTLDSFLNVVQTAWKKAAPDTLGKYHIEMDLTNFSNIDAYNYIWLLTSVTQNLEIVDPFGEHLVKKYMIPSLHSDYELIKNNPTLINLKIIHTGNLGNTLSIGSFIKNDPQTFLSTYQLYTNFSQLFKTFSTADSTANQYAKAQLNAIDLNYYDFNARNSFYTQHFEKAYDYLLTGISLNKYQVNRAIAFSKIMIDQLLTTHQQEKSFNLLDTLAIHTTTDNLNRDTLLNLYLKVDAHLGAKKYAVIQKKLLPSAFKNTQQTIKLPAHWNLINTGLGQEAIKNAKYIVLDFWYTSCGPCLAEIPELNAFYQKVKDRKDVFFLSINTDAVNGKNNQSFVKQRSQQLQIKFPLVYDNESSKLSEQLNIKSFPYKIILNNKGEIISKTDNSLLTIASFETLLNELK